MFHKSHPAKAMASTVSSNITKKYEYIVVGFDPFPYEQPQQHKSYYVAANRPATRSTTRVNDALTVVNMASYAICSSLILVIHDNMINETNHIVEHAFVNISRTHGCNHNQS
jgi:hypothetical protein